VLVRYNRLLCSPETYAPCGCFYAEPFDSDQFIYELKIDRFRALAYIEAGRGELIPGNGNTFRALQISRHGSLKTFALTALFSTGRLLALMMLAGRCFVICCSDVVSPCSSRLTFCTSTAKICECRRSSRERHC
jgi:hypothetical protein